jgi:5-hydroxyisourate hydrolase
MPGGVSIHAYDVASGVPAAGLRVELRAPDGKVLIDRPTDARGVLELAGVPSTGLYEATFHVGDWYRARSVALPEPAFLERVPFRFGVADLAQHYHLPIKMTPWGFSLFRGGA